jgi:hypothetical protein
MVIGDDVKRQMAPYQETNMGPIDPEHMTKIDVTEDVLELFHAPQRTWRLLSGRYTNFVEAHELDSSGQYVPIAGATMVNMTADEARRVHLGYATMDIAAEDYDARREGDRFFTLENVNSRWDGWEIGGGWASKLKLRAGRQGFTEIPMEIQFAKKLGGWPPTWEPKQGYCDRALKGDIDWAGMREDAGAEASREWHRMRSWVKGETWLSWAEVAARFPADAAREHFNSQSAILAIREGMRSLPEDERDWAIDDAWRGTHDDFVSARKAWAFVPSAVLSNGEWLENDARSWDTPPADLPWVKIFEDILDRASDDIMITVVDCHT